jgi:predicted DNA-binding transcriptional regulator AlpA
MTTTPTLLTKQLVCDRLNFSARTLEGMVRGNLFPKGVRVGKNLYWSEAAVDSWTIRMFGIQEAWTPCVATKRPEKRAGRA